MQSFKMLTLYILVGLALSSVACHGKTVADTRSRYDENEIHFRFDSAQILPKYREVLDKAVSHLKKHSDAVLVLEGRTDHYGDNNYNFDLGDRRARAVKTYIVSKGIAADRVVTVSFGEKTEGAASDMNNRRVVLKDTQD